MPPSPFMGDRHTYLSAASSNGNLIPPPLKLYHPLLPPSNSPEASFYSSTQPVYPSPAVMQLQSIASSSQQQASSSQSLQTSEAEPQEPCARPTKKAAVCEEAHKKEATWARAQKKVAAVKKTSSDKLARALEIGPFADIIKTKRHASDGRTLTSEWSDEEVYDLLHLPESALRRPDPPEDSDTPRMLLWSSGCAQRGGSSPSNDQRSTGMMTRKTLPGSAGSLQTPPNNVGIDPTLTLLNSDGNHNLPLDTYVFGMDNRFHHAHKYGSWIENNTTKSHASDDNAFAGIIKSKRFSEARRVLVAEWKPEEVCGLLHLPKNATKPAPRPTVPCMIGKLGGCGGTVNLTVSGYFKRLKVAHPEIEDRLDCHWADDPAAEYCHCRQRRLRESFEDASSVPRHILRKHLRWGTPCPMSGCESKMWDVKSHLVVVHIKGGHSDDAESDNNETL
ncbi:hypothetical protein FISHEDRAFT_75255 [Fistulina hepatica ATCC 64428]|uniref:Uncharacterized protein n=1 Tax=Fistulina hepatica ATCC 64428 TaxID=1128425 RepID=A0A0D7A7Q6_9AGAR|nr:hypothetical protein FISHEDRAFT_75255 [Fistulina hepatica ATCC 64428]